MNKNTAMQSKTSKTIALLHYLPQFLVKLLMFAMMTLALSCTSGKDNPVDSHPGSGSIKGGPDT
ncbi:hypothetical protein, partial [Pedobacter sp.]|uniref:hypothetical protein n=1 Tax=Pedobacter sp. TaxID=1411316 RepID=UPI003D7FECED